MLKVTQRSTRVIDNPNFLSINEQRLVSCAQTIRALLMLLCGQAYRLIFCYTTKWHGEISHLSRNVLSYLWDLGSK